MTGTRSQTVCLAGLVLLFSTTCLRADDAETHAVKAIERLAAKLPTENGWTVNLCLITWPRFTSMAKNVTDASLEELASLNELRCSNLMSTQITDAGLKELATLQKLQSLNLAFTPVTDAGLQELASLKELHSLNLWHTQVTDAGMTRWPHSRSSSR